MCGIVEDVAITAILLEVGTGGVGVGMNEDGGDGKEVADAPVDLVEG